MPFAPAPGSFVADILFATALATLLAVPLASLYDYLARAAAPALSRGHYAVAFLGVVPFATHWVVARALAADLAADRISPGSALLAGTLAEAAVVVLTCAVAVRLGDVPEGGHGGGPEGGPEGGPRFVWVPVPAFVPPRRKCTRRG